MENLDTQDPKIRAGKNKGNNENPEDPSISDLIPPEEDMWEKYSPHYEAPIAMVGSFFIHIFVAVIAIIYITMLLNFDFKEPIPLHDVKLIGDGDGGGDGSSGSGGGEQNDKKDSTEDPEDVVRPQPDDVQIQEIKDSIVDWSPDLKDQGDLVKNIAQTPNIDKLKKVNSDLRKKLLEGISGKRGKGNQAGEGTTGDAGSGSTGKGDSNSTGERSLRWRLTFDTKSGEDYLNQLAVLRARLLIPVGGQKVELIADLRNPRNRVPFNEATITEMHFEDDKPSSVRKLALALGLDFVPDLIIVLFPRDVEEELAKKERAYRNMKIEDIYSTSFQVLIRDGKYEIVVTDQKPKKKR